MDNKLFIWFKGLSEGWRTFTILSGFIVCVATTAVAIDHFKTKVTNASVVLKYLQKQDTIQTLRYNKITLHLVHISDSLRHEYENQKVFQDNYSNFVSSKTGSVKEWMKYMNGMQITVVQDPYIPNKSLEEVKPSFKIRIVPVNKNDTIKK